MTMRSLCLLVYGGTVAAIGRAVYVTTKSTHEAFGIPTPKANAEGLRMTRMAIYLARNPSLIGCPNSNASAILSAAKSTPIVDRSWRSAMAMSPSARSAASESGVLDIPWSPNR